MIICEYNVHGNPCGDPNCILNHFIVAPSEILNDQDLFNPLTIQFVFDCRGRFRKPFHRND